MKSKLLMLLLASSSLLLAPRSVAQTGAVTKSTASATLNDLTADLNVPSGKTATVKAGGTLTGAGIFDFSAGTLTLANNQVTWAKVNKTGSSLADLATRSFADLQGKPTTLAGYGITDAITAAAVAAAYQPIDADLTSIAANATGGFLTRTAANTYTARAIAGTAGQITVTNGDGVAGAPVISLPTTITQATTFSGTATFSNNAASGAYGVLISSSDPRLAFRDLDAGSDSKLYDILNSSGTLLFRAVNDADSAAVNWLSVARTGTTINSVTIPNGVFSVSNTTASTSTTTGSASFGGGIGVAGAGYFGTGVVTTSGGFSASSGNIATGTGAMLSGSYHAAGTASVNAAELAGGASYAYLKSYATVGGAKAPLSLEGSTVTIRTSTGSGTVAATFDVSQNQTLAGNLTFGNSGSVLSGTTGSIGITATGTNQSIALTPSGTGFVALGSGTEKMGLNGGSLSFNRAISTGGIYDTTGYGYQWQHTKSTTAVSDLLALGVYTPAGSNVTNYALVFNGAGNILLGTATDSSNGRMQLASHTTAGGGFGLGTDWSFYRVSSSAVRMASSATNASELNILSTNGYDAALTLSTSGGSGGIKMKAGTNTVAIQPNGGAPTVDFGSVNGAVLINSTTASTSTTTGALTVAGGMGVAGAGYFGGALNVAPAAGGTVATFGATANNNSIIVTRTGGATLSLQTSTFDSYVNGSGTLQLYSNNTAAVIIGAGGGANTQAAFQSTTEATTGGAGSITTAGGIYAAKKIIAGTSISPSASAVTWTAGAGSPEGVVTAVVGSLYSRTDGGVGTSLYVKESGSGNTGWAAK